MALQHITEFTNYLLHQKRMSEHTVVAYNTDLNQFNVFIGSQILTDEEVHSKLVRNWISTLALDKISTKSIHRKLSSLRRYFIYLKKYQGINNNAMSKVISPKMEKRIVSDIPAMDLFNMFKNFPWNEQENGKRDKLILLTLYTCGLRISELMQLKSSNVDLAKNELRVLGKRNKMRIIPIHPELIHEFKTYSYQTYIFEIKPGIPLYPMFINRLVHTYLKLFSSAMHTHPHTLRHSFATHLLNNGANIIAIKDLLGHASLAATQVYTKNNIEKLKLMHALHPRD